MSRSNQQMRLVQELFRMIQSGKLKMRWIVLAVVLVVGYFLAQPVLKRTLNVNLPGFGDLVSSSQSTETPSTNTPPATTDGKKSNSPPANPSVSGLIGKILNSSSRETYTSPAGLRYTSGREHRLKHVMRHAKDDPDRTGPHGVFDESDPIKVIALIDEAYLQAQTGRDTHAKHEGERIIYEVNFRHRIGYVGGTSGKRQGRPVANYLRLILAGDRVITAFPVRL